MKWGCHIASKKCRNANNVLVAKHERKNHLGNLGVDGKIILKSILKKYEGNVWAGLIRLRIEINGGQL
jgi:hypothetical protein